MKIIEVNGSSNRPHSILIQVILEVSLEPTVLSFDKHISVYKIAHNSFTRPSVVKLGRKKNTLCDQLMTSTRQNVMQLLCGLASMIFNALDLYVVLCMVYAMKH